MSFNLFRSGLFRLSKAICQKRSLYTDPIYPYPRKYVNEVKYPGNYAYRETWEYPWWHAAQQKSAIFGFRMIWFYIGTAFLTNPGAITGHYFPPDPSSFTDEELGIPPDSEGSYYDWMDRNKIKDED